MKSGMRTSRPADRIKIFILNFEVIECNNRKLKMTGRYNDRNVVRIKTKLCILVRIEKHVTMLR